MAIEQEEENIRLSDAGIEEQKIFKALAKLRNYPKVRALFRESAKLFRTGKIKNIREIKNHPKLKKIVRSFNHAEKRQYEKHLKEIGFPSLNDLGILIKKTKVAVKLIGKKKDEIKEAGKRFSDEIQNVLQRKNPLLKVLNKHIKFLGNESFFQKAHRTAKVGNIIERSERSIEFYQEYALEYGKNFDFRDMLREGGIRRSAFFLGRMYFYRYIPEIPDSTFDMYPLTFVLSRNDETFEGINFHFMNPKQRGILMERMFQYLNKQDYRKNQRILFNTFTKVLRNNRKFKYGKFSYRRYSFDAISSKIIEVHPLDWEIAMSVSSERFYSMDKRRLPNKIIWKTTDKRVKRNK